MEGKLMNEIVKNVLITSVVIGSIKLYGKVKYIQGIVDANKILNEEFEKRANRRRTTYYSEEGR